MKPFCLALKLVIVSSVEAATMSESLTLRRGALVVAVFLSQIMRFLAASLISFCFTFSVSRVTKTSSSSGGRKGDLGFVALRDAVFYCDA